MKYGFKHVYLFFSCVYICQSNKLTCHYVLLTRSKIRRCIFICKSSMHPYCMVIIWRCYFGFLYTSGYERSNRSVSRAFSSSIQAFLCVFDIHCLCILAVIWTKKTCLSARISYLGNDEGVSTIFSAKMFDWRPHYSFSFQFLMDDSNFEIEATLDQELWNELWK